MAFPDFWPAADVDPDRADLERPGHGLVQPLGEDREGIRRQDRDGLARFGPDELIIRRRPLKSLYRTKKLVARRRVVAGG